MSPVVGIRRGWLGVVVLLGGCSANTYVCASDDACPGGTCEPDGFCSFPDPDCPTGSRYGEFSGPNAGACVGQDGAQGTETAPTSASASATTAMSDTASDETTSPPMTTTANPTGAGGCGDETCYPAAPQGWDGPVRMAGNPPDCDALGGSPLLEGASSFSGNWSCDCECDLFIESACSGSVLLRFYGDEDCADAPLDVVLLQDGCESTDFPGVAVQIFGVPDATCSVSPIDDASPVEAEDAQVLCDVTPTDICEDGLCLPDSAAPTCIYQDGETPQCPAGIYSARTVLFRSVADTRACTPCSCSAEGGCSGSVEFASSCAGGGSTTVVPVGDCVGTDGLGPATSIRSLVPDGSLSCVEQGGEQDGNLTGTEAFTACCAP